MTIRIGCRYRNQVGVRFRFYTLLTCLFLSTASSSAVAASAPQSLEIEFVGVEGAVLENLRRHVRLSARAQDNASLSSGELRRLRKRALPEIRQALEPFGYYRAEIKLEQVALPERHIYKIKLNQAVTVQSLEIDLLDPAIKQSEFVEWRDEYPLKVGNKLLQHEHDAAKKRLIATALRLGYFDARFAEHQILIDQQRTTASIKLTFASGPQYSVSESRVEWNTVDAADKTDKPLIDDRLLQSLIAIRDGEIYDAGALIKTQQNLLATPYFSSVSVQAGETNTDNASVPIIIRLTPRKRSAYSAEMGVGTDTGIRGGIGYENRRVNQRGHHLSLRVGGSEVKRSAILNYRIPATRSVKDGINLFSVLKEENGDNRQFQQTKIGIERLWSWRDSLLKYGLTASRETFDRPGESTNQIQQSTDLLMPALRWEYVEADDLTFPTRGWSASAMLQGASTSLASDVDLAQAVIDFKGLRPLGSGRLKYRFKLAGSLIDETVDLPESLGFLAGGDESIRGYRFESIGNQRDDQTQVAKNLIVGSLEYQHPIRSGLLLATFVDIGDAFNGGADFKKGAGLGVRWRLPFGALRLDLASALDLQGDPLRLHFSFGTDL